VQVIAQIEPLELELEEALLVLDVDEALEALLLDELFDVPPAPPPPPVDVAPPAPPPPAELDDATLDEDDDEAAEDDDDDEDEPTMAPPTPVNAPLADEVLAPPPEPVAMPPVSSPQAPPTAVARRPSARRRFTLPTLHDSRRRSASAREGAKDSTRTARGTSPAVGPCVAVAQCLRRYAVQRLILLAGALEEGSALAHV
jgi:hypothetical protein